MSSIYRLAKANLREIDIEGLPNLIDFLKKNNTSYFHLVSIKEGDMVIFSEQQLAAQPRVSYSVRDVIHLSIYVPYDPNKVALLVKFLDVQNLYIHTWENQVTN